MATTDEEVFARFREDPALTREQAHLAYAAYAEAKYDWVKHVRAQTGAPPDAHQVEQWIGGLPESRFNELRLTSFAFFEEAAEAYMQEQIEAAKGKAIDSSILGDVRRLNQDLTTKVERATSGWTPWMIGIGSGVLASVLFTLMVIFGAWVFDRDASPFATVKGWLSHSPSPAAPTPGKPPAGPGG